MRNIFKNLIMWIVFIGALLLSFILTILPLSKFAVNNFQLESSKDVIIAIGAWIVCALTLIPKYKLHGFVWKPEDYCRDTYFVDRDQERKTLFAFLADESINNGTLFFVKGSMCRGKTVLLQRFADDVNKSFCKNEFQKEYPKSKKYSAYYIALNQSSEDIVSEIGFHINNAQNLNTCGKICNFLQKTCYRKNALLIIDNISKLQSHLVIETAQSLLYKNSHLKIILGITEDVMMSKPDILEPPLFGEIQVMELARKYNMNLSTEEKSEIIRISNGIPSYIKILFKSHASIMNLSNIEDIQSVVKAQLNSLGIDNKIAAYLACLNLCYDGTVIKEELLALAEASQVQLEDVFNAALARETDSPQGSAIIMDALVAKCCRNTIYCPKYFMRIYEFYKQLNPNSDIAFIALFLIVDTTLQQNITKDLLINKYEEKKFLLFAKLGELEQQETIRIFHEDLDLYNTFRYLYLSSLLELGEYALAINMLKRYENSQQGMPSLRSCYTESGFQMQYLIINLHHLSNQFVLALWEMETILSQTVDLQLEHRNQLLYLKAHCLKHIGDQLKEADNILERLEKEQLSISLYIKVLSSRMAIHLFWGDTTYDYETTLQYLRTLPENRTPEQLHAVRHMAHYAWKQKNSVNEALEIINWGLETLEITRWRIIYDFYFEKAEWLRIQNIEKGNDVNDISIILDLYNKAIIFAEENMDNNLACCAQLGKILTLFPKHGHSESWCADQQKIVDSVYTMMENAHLEINKAYAIYIKTLLSKKLPSPEFIRYCAEKGYYDLSKHIEKGTPLKLTVM